MMHKNNQTYLFIRAILVFFLLNIYTISFAQIEIGKWRDHLPYSFAKCLATDGKSVFVGTNHSAFSFDIKTKQLKKHGKVEGFSDLDLQSIIYHTPTRQWVMAYKNANIDFFKDGTVSNLSDIVSKPEITYKTVNDILITETDIWLACSFGIIKMNPDKNEITDTYFIGEYGSMQSVDKIVRINNYLYILSNGKILKAPIQSNFLNNPDEWSTIILPLDFIPFNLQAIQSKLIVSGLQNSKVFSILWDESTQQESFRLEMQNTDFNIKVSGNLFFILSADNISQYTSEGVFMKQWKEYSFGKIQASDILYDEIHKTYYIADKQYGLVEIQESGMQYHFPNGPLNHHTFRLASANGIVYSTGGAVDLAWGPLFYNPELYRFKDNRWDSYIDFSGVAHDFIDLAVNPKNSNQVMLGSWSNGIMEWNNGEFKQYFNHINSTLTNMPPYTSGHVRVGGLTFDFKNRLWVTNSGTNLPLHMLDSENIWYKMSENIQLNAPTIGKILVATDETKWCILPRGNGLLAYSDANTPEIVADDKWKKISLINRAGTLITNQIFDVAQDKNDALWLGTDKGVLVIYSPSLVFNSTLYADEITVLEEENDSVAQVLLANESVTAIATDGANRKWLGTSNSGVFLVSENGTKTLAHFTAENSPLLSNLILDIEVNGLSGEVFFATEKGLISYMGSSTTGRNNFEGLYVYPNPVRPDYKGQIVIAGLVANTEIYITDVAGNTVYRTTALGGQAVWDGTNGNKEMVSSGVYIVFCASPDGSQSASTKLLIIR